MEENQKNDVKAIEVEVTPEMEEAGFRVLSASGIADGYSGADRLLVAEIYRAMFAQVLEEKRMAEPAIDHARATEKIQYKCAR